MRPGPWLVLAWALLVSGCTDPDLAIRSEAPTTEATDTSDLAPELPPDAPAPWTVGDWWSYHYTSRLGGVDSFDLTVVVAEDKTDSWTLTSAEPKHVNETFFTHIPSFGPVRKSDFAVTRHGHYTPFLKFPLAEGATWNVEVRGTWTATARRADLDAGGKTLPGWRIEYRTGEALQHVIEWSPQTNWIVAELNYQGQATPRHELRIQKWGSGLAGPFRVYEASDLHVKGHFFDPAQPQATTGSESFTVPSDGQGILLGAFQGGTSGMCSHFYTAPAGAPEPGGTAGACGPPRLEWSTTIVTPGTWTSDWAVSGEGSFVFAEALLLQIRDARPSV